MKLTTHDACWDAAASPWSDRALQAGARWVKVIDDPARAYAVAKAYPGCQVIYRKVMPRDIEQLSDIRRHPEFGDAQACAEMLIRLTDVRAAPNLWIEGANEIKLATLDDALWYGRVEALRARLLFGMGMHAIIGNFATGNPTIDLFKAFITAFMQWGGQAGTVLLGQHEYGAIDVRAINDGHNLLRHRQLRAYAPGFGWAITECGLDRIMIGGQYVGGGWRKEGAAIDQGAYWRYMLDFNAELERDPEVKCACIFTYGDTSSWKDYEMNDANEFNAQLIDAIKADGAAAQPKPDCNRTDVPDNWTHQVEGVQGLNVRSEPKVSTPSAANVICAMPNGKQVRAIRRVGDWMQIDWPVAGYSFAPNLKPREAARPPLHKLGQLITLPSGARFVDVSAWQDPADVDWRALAWNGCAAAMIRVAAGTLTDPEWHLYAAGAASAGLPWWAYVYYSFTVSWQSQIAALTVAINKMAELPTVALDLEGANPSKADAELRQYLKALDLMGVPVALYTRQSWVNENLPQLSTIMGGAPLIVANYRYPINAAPALPVGFTRAHAWQHLAGEKVLTDKYYWARFMTRSGKYLDESMVLASGLTFNAGLL